MLNKNLTEKINNIKDVETVKELFEYLDNRNNNKFCQPFFVKAIKTDLEQTHTTTITRIIKNFLKLFHSYQS